MSRRLIIDGNAVYEIDEQCMLKRKLGKTETDKEKNKEKREEKNKEKILKRGDRKRKEGNSKE